MEQFSPMGDGSGGPRRDRMFVYSEKREILAMPTLAAVHPPATTREGWGNQLKILSAKNGPAPRP
jgi:hypothetical protein